MSLKLLNSLQTNEASKKHVKSIRKLRKIRFLTKFSNYLTNNQTGFTIHIFALLTLAYSLFPGAEKFFFLQHKDPKSGLYRKGKDDVYFVFTWVILFIFLRAAIKKYVLIPLARLGGVKESVHQKRFAEQGWLFLYYLNSWTLGMYTMFKSPHWFDTTHLWKGYPHAEMSTLFKLYYLLQLSFCIQQIVSIHIDNEKDYFEMFAHHAIAILFTGCSYLTNFNRVGNAILCTMDLSDIVLPLSKMLKYCGFITVSNIVFGIFTLVWIVTRHGISWYIIYSAWFESTQLIEFKWIPEEGYYFTENVLIFNTVLFLSLQVIIHYWFYLICRILYRMITESNSNGNNARDDSKGDYNARDFNARTHGTHDDNKRDDDKIDDNSEWEDF